MTLLKKYPFTFEKKQYEIRVLYGDTTINIVAFNNNHPANGYRHQIKIMKSSDPEKLLETDAVNELVEMSKNDIIEKRLDKVAKIL
ncbi:hypothetical protein ACFL60_01630 [Candidatus Omnitrophota bacterium]